MSKEKIPKKLLFFKSSDKEWHETPDMSDLANCCSPVFCIITGNVNCGKSSLLKNLLVHKRPLTKELLYILHLERKRHNIQM